MSELKNEFGKVPAPVGRVWFVGAGPGAADLITLRGWEALGKADVVIADELAGPEVLRHRRPGAVVVPVGKRAGCHSASQAEINRLIVEHALAGSRVVRLKGGDPSVFGRLAEEMEALRVAGVPFEVVPGITAACAAAAAMQVPLTARPETPAALLVTGHECAGKDALVDWAQLARTPATICLYMGSRRLASIGAQLQAGGRAADTPLLVVSNVSLPHQSVLSGTLEEAALLEQNLPAGPAIIFVGPVAASNPALFAASAAALSHVA